MDKETDGLVQRVPPDKRRADAFARRMLEVLNHGMLGLMMSLGHRTGLFDALARLPPSTSAAIADAASLDERYVREWLGAMVTGRVVEFDGARQLYSLPPEHAAFLTRSAGSNNVAVRTQYIAALGNLEGEIAERFRFGGGVSSAAYSDFRRLRSNERAQHFDVHLLTHVVPLVAGLSERLAAGLDVVEIETSTGHAMNLLARAFPNSRFLGIDSCAEDLAVARDEARTWGLTNVTFEHRDVTTLESTSSYGLVLAFDCIHHVPNPQHLLRRIHETLQDGGVFLCADIAAHSHLADNFEHPLGAALYALSCLHCVPISLADGGPALGAAWGEESAREMLAAAGFLEVAVHHAPGDALLHYYVGQKRKLFSS